MLPGLLDPLQQRPCRLVSADIAGFESTQHEAAHVAAVEKDKRVPNAHATDRLPAGQTFDYGKRGPPHVHPVPLLNLAGGKVE